MKTGPVSVLVIDDDASVTETVSVMLRRAGFTVSVTTEPKKGVALARQMNPDVVLCDAAMPAMSGPEVIEALKADPATAGIPIVLMTGHAESHLFAHVQWASFLGKPFGLKELVASIRSAASHTVPPKIE